jgi:hypothetical protein
MGKPKPNLKLDIEIEPVNDSHGYPEYKRKSRLKRCPDMEIACNIGPSPFYFTDKHYPETNLDEN